MEIRKHFSDYLDAECERDAVRSIRYHLSHCVSCRQELEGWQAVQAGLRALPRRHVPPELGLRMRVELSREMHRNVLDRLLTRLDNIVHPLLLPASTGLVGAVLCIGLILGCETVPRSQAPDVPTRIATPPQIQTLAPLDFNTGDQPLVLVTHVDAEGRVLDYRILSGERSPEIESHLERLMYFSLFRPATMFGRPTDGRVVLSLRRITVRG